MKALVHTEYGPPGVLRLQEVETPTPGEHDVRVRVLATSVTTFDCWMRSCTGPPGFGLFVRFANGVRGPKRPILGTEMAGVIDAVGGGVTRFRRGDRVVGFMGMNLGAYAQYVCLPEDGVLTPMPDNLTFEQAAAFPQGALTALNFLRKGGIRRGQNVLIFGASGGVGLHAVQLAKHFGATVTGVCSAAKMALVESVGADEVIDYTHEDFADRSDRYDIVFDTVGKSPFSGSVRSLKPEGTYLSATFGLPRLLRILWFRLTSRKGEFSGLLEETTEDLAFLAELVEAGGLRPILDRCYPWERVAEAHGYVETGRKRGSVILSVGA
jgi:NADPH:quinone reductase-like Zn-dependent oxidoreductase